MALYSDLMVDKMIAFFSPCIYVHSQDKKLVPLNVTPDMLKSKNSSEADNLHRLATQESYLKHKGQKDDAIIGPALASSEGINPPSRDKLAVEGSLQTRCKPVTRPESGNHIKSQQKKAIVGCSTGKMPQSLLHELSTVLNQTGRAPREDS